MNLDKRLAQNLYADARNEAGAVGNESDGQLYGRAKGTPFSFRGRFIY
jgi:hypothetical protein